MVEDVVSRIIKDVVILIIEDVVILIIEDVVHIIVEDEDQGIITIMIKRVKVTVFTLLSQIILTQ